MGRSSNKQPRFQGSGGMDDAPSQDDALKHSAEYEQRQIDMLMNAKPRISWEEYKEKHKEQLEDRMSAGVEKEQADYRRQLDAERNAKLSRGRNNKHLADGNEEKSKKEKKKKDRKDKKKKSKKKKKLEKKSEKKKRSREGSSDPSRSSSRSRSSSSDSPSGSDSDDAGNKRQKTDEKEGPLRLSDFHSGKYDHD